MITAVAAGVDTARERIHEAWLLTDDPNRMQQSTDAAIAELRRADDSIASERLSERARGELATARQELEELVRHTRLLVTCTANLWNFADDLTAEDLRRAEADLCARQHDAFVQFGLNPLALPAEEAARTVAASRLRDPLLGFLLEWQFHADEAGTRNRLGQVVGAARRISGGAYKRWQDQLDRNDVTGLVAFTKSPDALAFSPSLVGALGRDLSTVRQFPARLTYLLAATDRYPHNPWLHFDLSFTCGAVEPPIPHEALRHLAAACALRPESALFQLQLGDCYSTLRAFGPAVQAYRKSIALYPSSARAYEWMGLALAKMKDEPGAIAAFKESARLSPDKPRAIRSAVLGLVAMGRPAEAVRTTLDALGRFPSWADNPRQYLRYNAACAAMICADGKGTPSISLAERQTFRKQALDLLAADLVALSKLAAADPGVRTQSAANLARRRRPGGHSPPTNSRPPTRGKEPLGRALGKCQIT